MWLTFRVFLAFLKAFFYTGNCLQFTGDPGLVVPYSVHIHPRLPLGLFDGMTSNLYAFILHIAQNHSNLNFSTPYYNVEMKRRAETKLTLCPRRVRLFKDDLYLHIGLLSS